MSADRKPPALFGKSDIQLTVRMSDARYRVDIYAEQSGFAVMLRTLASVEGASSVSMPIKQARLAASPHSPWEAIAAEALHALID